MDPLHIILIVLALLAIWAVIELALTLRRTRGAVDHLDKTVGELSDTIEEARPVIAKLDGAIDDVAPAMKQVEPLLTSATVAVDALSANLVEVEGVVRDVSAVTGAAAQASSAVSGLTGSATEAVHRLFNKRKADMPALHEPKPEDTGVPAAQPQPDASTGEASPALHKYFTSDADDSSTSLDDVSDAKEQ